MSLREEISKVGQTQGPKCAIQRYSKEFSEEAADLEALVLDETWVATRLSAELLRVRNWRIPSGAILKHRRRTCGCYQRLATS